MDNPMDLDPQERKYYRRHSGKERKDNRKEKGGKDDQIRTVRDSMLPKTALLQARPSGQWMNF